MINAVDTAVRPSSKATARAHQGVSCVHITARPMIRKADPMGAPLPQQLRRCWIRCRLQNRAVAEKHGRFSSTDVKRDLRKHEVLCGAEH